MAAYEREAKSDRAGTGLEDSYALYRAELARFFSLQSHDASVVDDLVQDVYERVLRYPSRKPVEDPLGYLFRVAWRLVKKANRGLYRYRNRYPLCDAADLDLLSQKLGSLWIRPEDSHEDAEREVQRLLERLPPQCQTVMLRKWRDGQSYEQIARDLQISTHTVKEHLVNGLSRLRAHFSAKHHER